MLSPPLGTCATEQIVLITSAAAGATLRYTTTGVDPTASDPEVPANGDVLITGATTLNARAWVPDRAPSMVASVAALQPLRTALADWSSLMTQQRHFRWPVVVDALAISLTVTALLVHLSDPLNHNVPGWTLTAGMVSGCAVMALWHPRPVLSSILFGAVCYPLLLWWTFVLILGFYEGP